MVGLAATRKQFQALTRTYQVATVSHAFDAVRMPSGNWAIRGLPIFGVCTDDRDPGEPIDFGSDWIHDAARFHAEQQARGYLAPAHVHHKGTRETIEAGMFANHQVRPHRCPESGRMVETLFADVVEIPPEVFERIKRLRVPYRSVEIPPERLPGGPKRPGFSSLALLTDDEPFFHHEITNVRVVEMGAGLDTPPNHFCVLAGTGKDGSRHFCIKFNGVRRMSEDTSIFQDEESMEEAPAEESAPESSMLEEKLDRIIEMLSGLVGGEAPEEDAAAADPESEEDFQARAAGDVRTFAKLSAENQQFRHELDAMKLSRSLDSRIARWKDERRSFDEKRIRKEAKQFGAKQGEYLDAIEAHLPIAPPSPSEGTAQADSTADQVDLDHPALAQFADAPQAVQKRAQHWLREWDGNVSFQSRPAVEFVRGIVTSEMRSAVAKDPEFRRTISEARREHLRLTAGRGV